MEDSGKRIEYFHYGALGKSLWNNVIGALMIFVAWIHCSFSVHRITVTHIWVWLECICRSATPFLQRISDYNIDTFWKKKIGC